MLNRTTFYNRTAVAVIAISTAMIGTMLWSASHAATPIVASEAESGVATAPASITSDTTASAGRAIKFGPTSPTLPPPPTNISSTNPCAHTAAPAQWKHVVVLMFENKTYNTVIGSPAPWITSMVQKCGTYTAWNDGNYKVGGALDGTYNSKPNYATLTSGVPPTVHGLKDDSYGTTTSVDNIFNRVNKAGKVSKDYVSGPGGGCASSNFSGAYHDAMRYYTNLGGQSSSPTTYCNTHDVPIGNFITDAKAGNLPEFSFIVPTNSQNMHDNSIASGDAWAKAFLVPFLDSAQYKSGDTALFFLWDENTPIPNVFMAPSIAPGSKPVPTSLVFSHYSALRTWQEMLGISPLLGDSGQAPSLLSYYNGK